MTRTKKGLTRTKSLLTFLKHSQDRARTGNTKSKQARLLRPLIIGSLAVVSWLVAMLVLLVGLPLALPIGLFGGPGGRRLLRSGGVAFLRGFFVRYLPLIGFHSFAELPGAEDLQRSPVCVFAANHRSWLDALLALALFPRVVVPVKSEYLRIPVLGVAMRWIGCLPLDASSPATMVAAVEQGRKAIAAGHPLFVFPEGTRAPGDRLLGFTDVFFRIAVDCAVPVVPVLIHSDRRYLSPQDQRLMPSRKPTWRIRTLEPVKPDRRDRAADVGRLVRRRLAAGLAELDDRSYQ